MEGFNVETGAVRKMKQFTSLENFKFNAWKVPLDDFLDSTRIKFEVFHGCVAGLAGQSIVGERSQCGEVGDSGLWSVSLLLSDSQLASQHKHNDKQKLFHG